MSLCSRITTPTIMLAASIVTLLSAATPAHAQTSLAVQCVDTLSRAPISCADTITSSGPLQSKRLAYRLVTPSGRPVANGLLVFRATSGQLSQDSTRTDSLGYAFTSWFRNRSADPAVVVAHARTTLGSEIAQRSISVRPATTQYGLMIDESTNLQTGFEKAPLRKSIFSYLGIFDKTRGDEGTPVANRDLCSSYKVAFTQIGKGSISPDTAIMWFDDAEKRCVAYANWTLGDGAGLRDARGTLVGPNVAPGNAAVEFEAYARAMPRIITGPAITRYRGYTGVRKGSSTTAKIERTLPDGKIVLDTTLRLTRDSIQEVSAEWKPVAVIGVGVPIIPRWHKLSLTAGVDINHPAREWYFGISVVRPFGELTSESLPVDAHLLAHFGRIDEVEDAVACATASRCGTDTRTVWHGLAAMISVDASGLVGEVLKKIGL